MRPIDGDALHDDLKAKQKRIVKREDKYSEGYTYDQVNALKHILDDWQKESGEWEEYIKGIS